MDKLHYCYAHTGAQEKKKRDLSDATDRGGTGSCISRVFAMPGLSGAV